MTTPVTATPEQPTPPAGDGGALLRLLWLASPALPVGAFSYSEGLETAVDTGRVSDEASARAWLLDQLQLVQARADLAVAAAAWRAWAAHDLERAAALNQWVLATRESAEFRLQTEQGGRSLADWLRQRLLDDAAAPEDDPRVAALRAFAPAPSWPLAFALAALRSGAGKRDALLAMAFGWAENMVQAAVKSVPLGQSAGQRLLAALAAAIPGAVDDAVARTDHTRQAFAPMLAILSARHEAQYSRLFRS
ncbi:MAG: urease accessory UreF family protein [Rubrivivax sp.]